MQYPFKVTFVVTKYVLTWGGAISELAKKTTWESQHMEDFMNSQLWNKHNKTGKHKDKTYGPYSRMMFKANHCLKCEKNTF